MFCHTPRQLLFSDLSDEEAEKWVAKLQHQPASDWDDVVTHAGWKNVPSTYLVTEGDAALPPPMQLQMAEGANAKIEKTSAGHVVQVSQPEKVVELIRKQAGESI